MRSYEQNLKIYKLNKQSTKSRISFKVDDIIYLKTIKVKKNANMIKT